MRIIPAIDIIEGKCVRLSQGDYSTKKIYNKDPLEVALEYEAHGIRNLHLVDLDGARARHIVNHRVLEKLASATTLEIDFGGGLRSGEDLRIAFESGASQVTGGSIAVREPEIFSSWLEKFGPERIILGADARDEKVAISGWTEGSGLELGPFIRGYMEKGVQYVICTDISRDGMLQGPSTALYRKLIAQNQGISLIASGGISSFDDLPVLEEIGCEGAIIGKAIYEGRISLKQLQEFMTKKGS